MLQHSLEAGVMDYMGRRGDADPSRTFVPAGQGSGSIHEIRPATEIMERIVREAEQIVGVLSQESRTSFER
ncbi:MAG: hypothetical protein ACREA0_03250 [bacterium]